MVAGASVGYWEDWHLHSTCWPEDGSSCACWLYGQWAFARNSNYRARENGVALSWEESSLGGLVPGLLLSSGNAEVAAEANRLYVHVRLPHHLVISSFATYRVVAFFSLVCGLGLAWFLSAKWRQDEHGVMAGLAIASLLLVVIGILVTLLLGNDSPIQHSLLRFYFYRTSDVLVPLAAAVLACVVVFNVSEEIGSGIRLRGSISFSCLEFMSGKACIVGIGIHGPVVTY